MIAGIGSDVIEIARIELALARLSDKFLKRVLGQKELDLAKTLHGHRLAEFVAGRFAVKEAMAKACGLGIGAIGLSHVSVTTTGQGLMVHLEERCPLVQLGGDWHVSISHTESVAFAVAILER